MKFIPRIFSWLLSFLTITVGIVFSTLNNHEVFLNCYFISYNISLGILLVIVLFVGALLSYVSIMPKLIKNHSTVKSLQRSLDKARQEIAKVKVDAGKQ
ncbi:MAG: LapA family protein [Legionellales bacterium]|nr:LapA family protein [Legionellales bacterium]